MPRDGEGRGAWVREHRVWSEVVPSDRVHGGDDDWVPAGLELRLYGRCLGLKGLDPSDPECLETFQRLGDVLLAAVPPGLRCRIHSFEPALHLRPETELAPEVELVAEIDVEGEPLSRVDPADRRAAQWLLDNLAAEGVRPRGPAAA